MRIIITGSEGRIGTALQKAWLGRHVITCFDRAFGHDLAQGAAFPEADALVHLAINPGHDLAASRENALITTAVLAASERIPRIVLASSVWADHALYEPGQPQDFYSADKLFGEALCRAWATDGRIAVCLRLGCFYAGAPEEAFAADPLMLSERSLAFWFDRALTWDQPGARVWSAVGRG